ncbi:hypothetical protein BDV28DRAFT_140550 [Aspergillus coremiiformis]|uniref:Uncharacterized protein n=1 Tax=Aspergillus coremiiformis TaxID=138285 RepID=A0A5N6YZC0_9EURO|nr:hypothetical protein BDV28DRAFT_140550 [Aspergillus coremiiformis]
MTALNSFLFGFHEGKLVLSVMIGFVLLAMFSIARVYRECPDVCTYEDPSSRI